MDKWISTKDRLPEDGVDATAGAAGRRRKWLTRT